MICMDNKKTISEQIDIKLKLCRVRMKSIRERHGLSQEEFAKRIGISNATISRYEAGLRAPDIETILAIADEFKVPVNWLCGDEKDTDDISALLSQLTTEEKQSAIKYVKFLIENR